MKQKKFKDNEKWKRNGYFERSITTQRYLRRNLQVRENVTEKHVACQNPRKCRKYECRLKSQKQIRGNGKRDTIQEQNNELTLREMKRKGTLKTKQEIIKKI